MSAIFISYRSTDLNLVKSLVEPLAAAFGRDQVVLDRITFISGEDWLQQIRANVAAAECLIVVMGPSWISPVSELRDSAMPDYVIEELTLARTLGKVILPILVQVSAKDVSAILPKEIDWLKKIHFLNWQLGGEQDSNLIASVASLAGIRAKSNLRSNRTHTNDFAILLRSAITRSLIGLVKPVGAAAASLRPNSTNLAVSSTQAIISVILLAAAGLLFSGDVTIYAIGKILVTVLTFAAIAFACHIVAQYVANAPRSGLSSSSFALHLAAVLFTSFSLWALLFWLVTPDRVHQHLISAANLPSGQQFVAMLEALTPSTQTFLMIVGNLFFLHTVYILFGNARGLAISLGSRRWLPFVVAAAVAFLATLVLLWLLTNAEGLRRQNLPRPLKLGWSHDEATIEGVKKAPILFEVDGNVDIRGGLIVVTIKRFDAENRDAPPIQLSAIWCGLGVLRGGNFEWTRPQLAGKLVIDQSLPKGARLRSDNLLIKIPLSDETESGETVLSCFVQTPNSSYPLGDGTSIILRW
jgi:TIR domain